jgi:hypothetical protein
MQFIYDTSPTSAESATKSEGTIPAVVLGNTVSV